MADNNNDCTRLQHMQTQINTLNSWMEEQHKRDIENHDRFEKLQKSMDMLLQHRSLSIGGSNSSSSSSGGLPVTPISSSAPVKDISLGFPYFDGHTPVLEWIFKVEKFFNYHLLWLLLYF